MAQFQVAAGTKVYITLPIPGTCFPNQAHAIVVIELHKIHDIIAAIKQFLNFNILKRNAVPKFQGLFFFLKYLHMIIEKSLSKR